MGAREAAVASRQARKPERGLRHFVAEQTPLSLVTAATGAAALLLLIAATAGVLTAGGWTTPEKLAQGVSSGSQLLVIVLAVCLGGAAMSLGFLLFRRMATKPSREMMLAGAVLGTHAVFLGLLLARFRAGDVETFARNFFHFSLLAEFWHRFTQGAVNTVVLALSGEGLGIVLGLVLSIFVLSARPVIRAPARLFINFLRGTPLLWQLTFGFFGIVLGLRLNLTVYQAAILILGLNAGAYSAEIFRAGVQSIERAQLEAARSLGMSYAQAMWYVILPQAVRRVIPPLTNEFVILIKDTSLVSVLGLTFNQQELMAAGREIYATFADATPFLGSAAGYLVVTLPMLRAVTWLERRLRSGLTGIGA